MNSGFYWHVHHDKLMEWCFDYKRRVEYIKSNKPDNEINIRLRLLQPVKDIGILEELEIEIQLAINAARNREISEDNLNKRREGLDAEHSRLFDINNVKGAAFNLKDMIISKEMKDIRKEKSKLLNLVMDNMKKVREASIRYYNILNNYKDIIKELHNRECTYCVWNGKELAFI